MPLRLVADENIPFVAEAFGSLAEVRLLPGAALTPVAVREADVLLVRSVTRVDAALLEGSAIRFVGSATIGVDHVDRAALAQRGIAFAHAPGSNAESVVEYVLASLLYLAAARGEPLRGRTVAVVGVGRIGGALAERLPVLGARVLPVDPPRAALAEAAGAAHPFAPLPEALAAADVVTLHVPLTRRGPHATFHLLDGPALARMRPEAWLLNTARGAAVDGAALRRVLTAGRPGAVVLDVWEGEPTPNPALVGAATLATPHIAGYSYDGKVAGTRMLYDALVAYLGCPAPWDAEAVLAPTPDDHLALAAPDPALPEAAWLHALAVQMYDVAADDARLRPYAGLAAPQQAAFFEALRKHYPRRRAFARHHLPEEAVPPAYRTAVAEGLGVRLTSCGRP